VQPGEAKVAPQQFDGTVEGVTHLVEPATGGIEMEPRYGSRK